VLAAFALAVPIAWERKAETRRMGLRTLPLVAVACCSVAWWPGSDSFGGGAILKGNDHVTGTATAASILFGVYGADPMVRRGPVRAWTLKPL